MRAVWKFSFNIMREENNLSVEVPSVNKLVHVREQGDDYLSLWFEVMPEAHHKVTRTFVLVETGFNLGDEDNLEYVGTGMFKYGTLVLHVYEVK